MKEQFSDKRGQWFVLNWMDGTRHWFHSFVEAQDFYRKEKNDCIDHQHEFDMGLYQFIEECNNIKS
jgi:hypothetical protein